MRALGFDTAFVDLLSHIASLSSSRLLINGHLSAPFQIKRSVRQGDPLSMHLFVLYLHPLLRRLEEVCGADLIIAYADDISAISTSVDKLEAMRDLFRRFERSAGARLNEEKTTAIDVGVITNPMVVPWLRTENSIKILGVIFVNSIRSMVKTNWDLLVTNFSRLVWLHSLRSLSLHQKVTLLNIFVSSRIWYMAANLLPATVHVAKLTATMRSYLFRGACATIPMEQLARRREDGGLNLQLPALKCKALLINRHLQEIVSLPYYCSFLSHTNVPPSDLPCLKLILNHIPNFPFQIRQQPSANLIHHFFLEQTAKPKVETANPAINWPRLWMNIAARNLLPSQRSTLYMWTNEKFSHRRLMYVMRRTNDESCLHCSATIETIQHKFFGCPRVRAAYDLLQQKLLVITGRRRVLHSDNLLRPSLEGIAANERTLILKLLLTYITFIDRCNDRIDIDELKFYFDVGD